MNAYELADELEKRELEAMEYGFDKHLFLAATMLRQQADEIKQLKKQLKAACSQLIDINLKVKK